jgi:hypothetical protein
MSKIPFVFSCVLIVSFVCIWGLFLLLFVVLFSFSFAFKKVFLLPSFLLHENEEVCVCVLI